MPKPRPQTPRETFTIALADWQRAWTTHAHHDRRAASAGFATATGKAHLAAMSAITTRIADIESQIAQTPANNCAELYIKIKVLSLDGQIREEFQSGILEDAMLIIAEAEALGQAIRVDNGSELISRDLDLWAYILTASLVSISQLAQFFCW